MSALLSDQIEENSKTSIELSEESVREVWLAAIRHIHKKVNPALVDIAHRAGIGWVVPATITVEVESKLSEGVLTENKMTISAGLREVTGRTDLNLSIIHHRTEEFEQKARKLLSPREKYRLMEEQNPVLLDLRKRLDLDLS